MTRTNRKRTRSRSPPSPSPRRRPRLSKPGPEPLSQPANTTANNHLGSFNPLLSSIFPIRVDALRDIATVSFAASLVQYKLNLIRKHSDDDDKSKLLNLQETPEIDFVSVPLPTAVERKTTALLPIMYNSLQVWKKYHYRTIFWDLNRCEDIPVSEWFDEIVWMSDGTIHKGQTAENLLHSGKMSAIVEYRLACVYCFEDSVTNLGSTLGNKCLKLDLKQHKKFRSFEIVNGRGGNSLFDYWHSIMIGKSLPKVQLIRILDNLIEHDKLNSNAIEYLWNNVHSKDWIHMLDTICDTCDPFCMWRVLIGLNASEFDAVIGKKDYHILILKCFANDSRFEEVAITIWRYMLDVIVDDDKLVYNFIAARGENNYNVFDVERETHLIQQMWHTAPERLRPAIHQGIKDNISLQDVEDDSSSDDIDDLEDLPPYFERRPCRISVPRIGRHFMSFGNDENE